MNRRSSIVAIVGVALLVVATGCASSDLLGPDALQGIDGMVLLGPQCPVQRQDDPCPDLPYQAWIQVRRRGGGFVTRVRSGDDGRFRLGLRPGTYLLDPESGSPFPSATDEEAVVESGVYTDVVIRFDTGIR
jgi:hypothetical protein